jgi:hypothetical protein
MDRVLLCWKRITGIEYKLIQTHPNGKLESSEYYLDRAYNWQVTPREPTLEEFKTYRSYIVIEITAY